MIAVGIGLSPSFRTVLNGAAGGVFFLNGVKINDLSYNVMLAAGANTITGTGSGILSGVVSNGSSATIPVLTSATGVASGGGNVTISANSFYGAGYEAWKACDGIGTTDFVTNSGGNSWWIMAQYATPIVPYTITLKGRTTQLVNYPNAGIVEGSNNNTDWDVLIASVPALPASSGDQTFAITTTTAYSYIRYRSTQKSPTAINDNIGLATFQISTAVSSSITYAINANATLTLSAANKYTGTTIVNSGTIKVNNASALSTGAVAVNGGTLDLTWFGYGALPTYTLNAGGTIKRAFIPSDLTSTVLWLDGLDRTTQYTDAGGTVQSTANGQVILSWRNKGSVAGLATPISGSPTRDTAGIVISSNGYQFNFTLTGLNTQYAISAIVKNSVRVDGGCIFTSTYAGSPVQMAVGGGSMSSILADNRYSSGSWGENSVFPSVVDLSQSVLLSAVFTGATRFAKTDGTVGTPVADTRNISANLPYRIGRRWDTASYWNGTYVDVVVSNDYTKADAIDGALAWMRGIQTNLPVAHIYKSAPPVSTITTSGTTVA